MTNTIKASEVRPGMEVQFDLSGWDVKGTVGTVKVLLRSVWIYTEKCRVMSLELDSPVTVLAEPQPEEPQEFGEKVVVAGERALCIAQGLWLTDGLDRCTWDDLCEMGPVTVIPDQGWTVPTDIPEVPERIDEWDTWEDVPEGVVVTVSGLFGHYRKNQGVVEFSDPDDDPDWTKPGVRTMPHSYGPWTRVKDDTPEVPDRIEEWPENDAHLREQWWQDRKGAVWSSRDGQWGYLSFTRGWVGLVGNRYPFDGPWVRVP